jgi:4-amino-4-deoxy-L-arabinose transferase-like glycosyltransferase
MAALQMVFGHCAAFAVTPIAAGVLVLCTFGIGRQIRSPAAGLIAASLVATSPALLFMLMWPMTDVPAAAAAALVVWCLLRGSPASALAAGLAAAAGVLIRPNFVTIAGGAGLWLLAEVLAGSRAAGLRRFSLFILGVVPGILAMLWWNARLFGSPLASGYGTAGELFDWSRVAVNAGQYTRWLWETSPLAFVGLAVLLLPGTAMGRGPAGPRARWLLTLIVLSAAGIYLFYLPFPEWWYLRFLLPAWPALFGAAGAALDALSQRWRRLSPLLLVVVLAAGVAGIAVAKRRGVFAIGATERRYVSVARLVDQNTDPGSVIITWQHAGTLRYYAGRETLRYDLLDPRSLDLAIAWLADRGRHPYLLVEDGERTMFEARFASHNAHGRLDYSPAAAWQASRTPGWVFLYDPLRRDAQTVQPGPMIELAQPICAPPK